MIMFNFFLGIALTARTRTNYFVPISKDELTTEKTMNDPNHPTVAVLDKTIAPTKQISNASFQTGSGMSEENEQLFLKPQMHEFHVQSTTMNGSGPKVKKRQSEPVPSVLKKKKIKSNIVTY